MTRRHHFEKYKSDEQNTVRWVSGWRAQIAGGIPCWGPTHHLSKNQGSSMVIAVSSLVTAHFDEGDAMTSLKSQTLSFAYPGVMVSSSTTEMTHGDIQAAIDAYRVAIRNLTTADCRVL